VRCIVGWQIKNAHLLRKAKNVQRFQCRKNAKKSTTDSLRTGKDSAALLYNSQEWLPTGIGPVFWLETQTCCISYSNGSCAGFEPASLFTLLSLQLFKPRFLTEYSIVFSITQLFYIVNPKAWFSSFCIKFFLFYSQLRGCHVNYNE